MNDSSDPAQGLTTVPDVGSLVEYGMNSFNTGPERRCCITPALNCGSLAR